MRAVERLSCLRHTLCTALSRTYLESKSPSPLALLASRAFTTALYSPLQPPHHADTIFALSSGTSPAAIAVIRVSGPKTTDAFAKLTANPAAALTPPRTASLFKLFHPTSKDLLDQALVLRFPRTSSFTGEDSCEFHIHGGIQVVKSVLDALSSLPGLRLRPARPGEFTERAFHANKLDLSQVEGLADLISAETEAQRRQAVSQVDGALSRAHARWRSTLLTSLGRLEAVLDFGEDEEIGDEIVDEVTEVLRSLRTELKGHLDTKDRGELVRQGVKVALLGAPNVGKSSLLNTLARRDVAIVSPIAGTTRDAIEVALDLNGYKVSLTDGAGMRETEDDLERQGVERAVRAAEQAHIILHLQQPHNNINNDNSDDGAFLQRQLELLRDRGAILLSVLNKSDLLPYEDREEQQHRYDAVISCTQGCGVDVMVDTLTAKIKHLVEGRGGVREGRRGNGGETSSLSPSSSLQHQGNGYVDDVGSLVVMTRPRHMHCLSEAVAALERYEGETDEGGGRRLELAAEEVRKAVKSLGYIVGEVGTEEVLGSIFQEFCIGK